LGAQPPDQLGVLRSELKRDHGTEGETARIDSFDAERFD
jgi:hypothetical protein